MFGPVKKTTKKMFSFAALISSLCMLSLIGLSQDKHKMPGGDWVSLFNGGDLNGWEKVGHESWTVENGVIHGKGLTPDYGYLQTEKLYRDFQLSLRFKCVGDGNSGVFFHSAFKPGTADVTQGMQFEIDCNMMHHTGGVYAEDGRQWVVWPAPENESVVKMAEWNDYLVEVQGNRYRSRLNGVPMVDFTDPKPGAPDGTIALQLHAGGRGNMEFRDIWIRDLSHR
jgi:3-keto-disaccharide hydrolase